MDYFIGKFLAGEPFDVVILQDLFIKVGGCFSAEGADDDQVIWGRGGGATLRAETAIFGIKEEKIYSRPKGRLRDVMLNKEIGGPLLVLLARQRMRLLYDSSIKLGLEVTATIYDRCSNVLTMMVEFMSSDREKFFEYVEIVPAIGNLLSSYHLGAAEAFAIARPIIRRSLFKDALQSDTSKSDKGKASDSKKRPDEIEAAKRKAEELDGLLAKWNPYSEAMGSALRQALPESLWTVMNLSLYTTFWSLSLYDLVVPVRTYEEVIANKMKQLKTLQDNACKPSYRDVKDKAKEAARKELKEKENLVQTLEKELEAQRKQVATVLGLMKEKAPSFFPEKLDFDDPAVCGLFVENLILPRVLLSREDALYAAHFFHLLHDLEIPNFDSKRLYNSVFIMVLPRLVTSTKEEALNLGYFVREIFGRMSEWGKSEEVFLEKTRYKVWLLVLLCLNVLSICMVPMQCCRFCLNSGYWVHDLFLLLEEGTLLF